MSDIAVVIVAAVARNGVIGSGGEMPWRLSTDLKRFRSLTMGKPVIMGRKTYDALGKPLAGRTNIVVTRSPDFAPDGVMVVSDPEVAIAAATEVARRDGQGEVAVIGGGQIYAATINRADRLYITHVEANPAGDTRFPLINPAVWAVASTDKFPPGEKDTEATTFVVYERRVRQS